MSRPLTQVVQVAYQNPDATAPLYVPVAIVCNTSDEVLQSNVTINSAANHEWVACQAAHEIKAVMVGGGPSLADCIEDVRKMQEAGATIFAMNGSAKFLEDRGIVADYQVIADAREQTSELISHAKNHLFASQAHPSCFAMVEGAVLWHLEIGNIERWFPADRLAMGGYALIGGGAAVGNSALCLAYAMGYRDIHIFGYDSCHRDGKGHAYDQPMNRFDPTMSVRFAGRDYTASFTMRCQAEKFQLTAAALKGGGASITVYGDGLLQSMYRTPFEKMEERDKYQRLWEFDTYRSEAPGEGLAEKFLEVVRPDSLVIDYGCGTGRGALAISNSGVEVLLLDFASNCRDQEALCLPFYECDLTAEITVKSKYGFCTDVMEHIRPEDVECVLRNIMRSSDIVFFSISTVPDAMGALIGQDLHLTVRPPEWWALEFDRLGYKISWCEHDNFSASFVITNGDIR